jgi:electron transport complex protein RnfG
MKNSYIGQAWLVLLLALCFGAGLAGVEAALKGRIQQNKLEDTLGQIPLLVPGAAKGEQQEAGEMTVYRAVSESGGLVGWVVKAGGQGFADKIELLVGLNPGATEITGLYVLDQKETPGLGNKIVEQDWRSQFVGKSAAAGLTVTKGTATGNEVEAVTGATISSDSVVGIINQAVRDFRAVKDGLQGAGS